MSRSFALPVRSRTDGASCFFPARDAEKAREEPAQASIAGYGPPRASVFPVVRPACLLGRARCGNLALRSDGRNQRDPQPAPSSRRHPALPRGHAHLADAASRLQPGALLTGARAVSSLLGDHRRRSSAAPAGKPRPRSTLPQVALGLLRRGGAPRGGRGVAPRAERAKLSAAQSAAAAVPMDSSFDQLESEGGDSGCLGTARPPAESWGNAVTPGNRPARRREAGAVRTARAPVAA